MPARSHDTPGTPQHMKAAFQVHTDDPIEFCVGIVDQPLADISAVMRGGLVEADRTDFAHGAFGLAHTPDQ